MNLVTITVVEVLSEPHESHGMYIVDVLGDSWGRIQKTKIYCRTLEEAKLVKIGYNYEG